MIECPVCDKTVRGLQCVCGWEVPPPIARPVEPAKPFVPAKRETVEKFKAAMKGFGRTSKEPYWRPEVVRNASQVNLIVIQADRFGPGSIPARFLRECKDYGCITEDNRLRERMPGEDWEDAA